MLCFWNAASAQTSYPSKKQADEAAGQGITFKIPNGFMNAELSGFKGMSMLNHDAPAVIAIAYPNDGETPDELSNRLLATLPKYFGGADAPVEWQSKQIDVHRGDRAGAGSFHTAMSGDRQLQAVLFQREWKGLTVVYGYFAMRGPKDNEKNVKKYWLDETGRNVKAFEAFWKSFPEN